jgi:hypothetical protein
MEVKDKPKTTGNGLDMVTFLGFYVIGNKLGIERMESYIRIDRKIPRLY